jgi:sulfite exporter TauE/SafE
MGIYFAAILLGLTSNIHCIGMCGPIALSLPLKRDSNFTIFTGILQYTFGRIVTYSFLGFVIGIIGITASTFGILQWVSILTGTVMIGYALSKWFGLKVSLNLPFGNKLPFINKGFGTLIHSKFLFKLFLFGMLNGLLPCGMVYFALLNALVAGDMMNGALAMALFGLGTSPGLILIAFAANKIPNSFRMKFSKYANALLFSVGFLVVLRGMNLNIPMISPKIDQKVQSKIKSPLNRKETVEMSCCHKPSSCDSTSE